MNEKVLITGGAGFIGSHLADSLLEHGKRVVILDNLSQGNIKNISNALKNSNCKFFNFDILDKEKLSNLFDSEKFETVFHLAANSDIRKSHINPDIDFQNTLLTTYNILFSMKEYNVKNLIFSSTSAVYGETNKKLTENTGSLMPVSHYGASKLACEAFISSFSKNYGISSIILRFPNVVGERATHGVIYDFINKLKKTPNILEVLGNGNQTKPYMYVKDLIDVILYIYSNRTDKIIDCYNIGTESRTTVREIAEMVLEEMNFNAEIKYLGGETGWIGDVPQFKYNLDKIHALGWRAKLSSNEAVRYAIKRMLENT